MSEINAVGKFDSIHWLLIHTLVKLPLQYNTGLNIESSNLLTKKKPNITQFVPFRNGFITMIATK